MGDELTKGRTLPHNLEAEKSVLGAILLDNNAINAAAETITAEDFYGEAHRLVFAAMCALSEDTAPIDAVTLAERLGRSDQLERAGGLAYLSELMDGLPRALNVGQYARIVKDKSSLRNLIASANSIITSAISGEDETDEIIDQAERRIFEIAEDKVKRGFLSIRDLAGDTMHELEELHERREFITGVPTGFKRLDTMTAGLQGGDLIILAARPSMGKTALALNIAQHVALRHGGSVGIFSLEMSTQQLIRRLMSAEAQVDNHKLATGFLSDKDLNDLLNALEVLATAKIFVDDSANPSLLEMRSKARRLQAEHGLDLLIIDYLQLMSLGKFENRNLEIGAISRALKGLAKELDVPVMALSQLSRAPEARSEHRPQLSDLRECVTGDTLVQLADGRRMPIEQLDGQTPEVWAMSSDGKLVRAACDKVWKVGRRAVLALRTMSGCCLRATSKHRMYSGDGWVRVAELSAGDRIAIPRRIPGLEAELLDNDDLRREATSDLFWDRIVAIEPAGEEDVYDLTVPGPASWIGNSLIQHNSGNLEQDADVVAFIYREEVYNPDPTVQGLAELIIAKQRNGPIGTVPLAFLKQFTAFKDRDDRDDPGEPWA